jgi:LysM repeat protein
MTVLASASSADKIKKLELWVDGFLVYVTASRDPSGQAEFVGTLFWKPEPGGHTLITRATDGRGSVGTSKAVRVNVTESAESKTSKVIQIAQPGDTLDSIAEENALTPEQILQANPDLVDPPYPGEWVNVPTGENVPPDSDDIPGGVDDDLEYGQDFPDLPAIPAAPIPPFAPPRFWSTFIQPPVEPTDLQVLPGNCLAVLTWSDRSNNEAGFYVYRLNPGARDWSIIAELGANSDQYTDQGVSGEYQYQVAAFNNFGETLSPIVRVNLPAQNCLRDVIGQVLEVEAESLAIDLPVEEAYCYAALKGHRPFERVPEDQWEFLRRMGPHVPQADFLIGNWNFHEYYAGANKRVIAPPEGGSPFRVEVECLGARMTDEGGESFSLGSFDQSHPPEEWDGRALTGRGNRFTLVYHIQPWTGPGGEPNGLSDPDIPAPFNLHRARNFNDCVAHSPGDAGSLLGCAMVEYPDKAPLVWDWNGVPEQIDGFRMYMNRSPVGGNWVDIEDVEKNFRAWVGPTQIPCGETWRYSVSAWDMNVESARSEFLALSGEECQDLALVEVELFIIRPGEGIDDGVQCTNPIICIPWTYDNTMETSGGLSFWTTQPGGDQTPMNIQNVDIAPEGDVGSPSIYLGMRETVTYHWADLPLCHVISDNGHAVCADRPARNNNKLVFLLQEGDTLHGRIVLNDYDSKSSDDRWCFAEFNFPPRTLEEWSNMNQTEENYNDQGYGYCYTSVRVRGLGRVGSSHVLPSSGGGPGMTAKESDLRITNIDRNRQGNARITIFNAGPDTLLQDAVTLSFQVARLESGEGGSPTTIFEHEERALLSIPAYGQTTVDTGQVLLEGFENRVRVVVNAVNFSDPDLSNNADCARIDVQDEDHVMVLECAR